MSWQTGGQAAQEVYWLPGDVLGSGTVGTGCLLELTHGKGPWLQPGDTVELEKPGYMASWLEGDRV